MSESKKKNKSEKKEKEEALEKVAADEKEFAPPKGKKLKEIQEDWDQVT